MKPGDRVRMSHPGKRDGEIGTVVAVGIPLSSHSCDPCECGVHLDIDGESWKIHKNFVELVNVTCRSCEFIEVNNTDAVGRPIKSIWVPRPTSFFGGWARHQWLKKYFNQECAIASPDTWAVLVERHGKPKLLVEEGGEWRVEVCHEDR